MDEGDDRPGASHPFVIERPVDMLRHAGASSSELGGCGGHVSSSLFFTLTSPRAKKLS